RRGAFAVRPNRCSTDGGSLRMQRKLEIRDFCERFWDSLFRSIAETKALNSVERRVYEYLWRHVEVRTRTYERPLGVSSVAPRLGCVEAVLTRALAAICRKGFARRLEPQPRRPLRIMLNLLLIEAAVEQAKHYFPQGA